MKWKRSKKANDTYRKSGEETNKGSAGVPENSMAPNDDMYDLDPESEDIDIDDVDDDDEEHPEAKDMTLSAKLQSHDSFQMANPSFTINSLNIRQSQDVS